jgi:hypothetical protein
MMKSSLNLENLNLADEVEVPAEEEKEEKGDDAEEVEAEDDEETKEEL